MNNCDYEKPMSICLRLSQPGSAEETKEWQQAILDSLDSR